MRKHWLQTTIGDQATLQRGIDITKAQQRPGKVPVISSGGVSSFHDTAAVQGPGVVLGRKGVVGSVFYVQGDYWPHDTTLWVKDFHGNHPRFVYYFFQSVARQIAEMDVGSANPTLNRNHVHPTEIRWPPLYEQHAIAEVLGSLDDKIEQNRKTAEVLERLARAIFRAWFVNFEPVKAKAVGATSFPGMPQPVFDALPTTFADSEIGPVPKGWEIGALYDAATFINGAAFKGSHFCHPPDGLPVVKIAELKNGITGQTKYSSRQELAEKYRIDSGEILYSWSGSPDTSLDTFLWVKGPALLNQHIFRVVTENDSQKYFVYYLLRHLRQPLIEIARNKQTTGLGHVTVGDMKRFFVVYPEQRTLSGFEDLVGPMFKKTFLAILETEKLAQMRDYLLPKLLSGEVTVREAGRIANNPEPVHETA